MSNAGHGIRRAAVAADIAATAFLLLWVLSTQDKTIRTQSPWQDDPYDAILGAVVLLAPALAIVTSLRLVAAQTQPPSVARSAQIRRACHISSGMVLGAACANWVAVAQGPYRGPVTPWLVVGLGIVTATAAVTIVLAAAAPSNRAPEGEVVDWVGDGAHLIHHLTRNRGHAGHIIDQAARRLRDRLRAHFHAACLGLSTFIAVGEVGALAVGERWTDTALIAFCVVLEIIGFLAICFVINDALRIITRPPRNRLTRYRDALIIGAGLGAQTGFTLRDLIYDLALHQPISDLGQIVTITTAAGFIGALAAGCLTAFVLSRSAV
jgi:hypothetical protein